jgi:hypothetical protein
MKGAGVHSAHTLPIEEGRVASKSPHYKFSYFLPISQQVVSADITKISAIAIFES